MLQALDALLAANLQPKFRVGRRALRRLLRSQRYALRVTHKRLSRQHDLSRNRQFRYIARQRRQFQQAGSPVLSVDTKKKELIGNFKSSGRIWRRAPLDVLATDFLNDALGKTIPDGIYDLARNAGYMVVGTSPETANCAIAATRSWWLAVGRHVYPGCPELLFGAHSGGANGNRVWLWKSAYNGWRTSSG